MVASEGLWQVTGAQPLLGALPTAQDADVLVLTHRVFREQFHGDPQVIGRAVSIDGRQMTIGAVLRTTSSRSCCRRPWHRYPRAWMLPRIA